MHRLSALAVLALGGLEAQGLPEVPAPAENAITSAKAILGKVLFWDEQVSSDDSMACGTCHRPGHGGSDPRAVRHPGPDHRLLTRDDGFGSPGTVKQGDGGSLLDGLFDQTRHVTGRVAASVLHASYAPDLFWDGRASGTFRDPLSGEVRIAKGGALESQALEPILNASEMAHAGRTWDDVAGKLRTAQPLRLATRLPGDLANAVQEHPTYPELFAAAFGDDAITPARIAFAIASYERTLVADQTPWDRFVAGERDALTEKQRRGLRYFSAFRCNECHPPPHFTDFSYRNIGVRPTHEDLGRHGVSGKDEDRGRFRVPSLRNVALRPRLMHNGAFESLTDAMRVYRFPRRGPDVDPLLRTPRNVDARGSTSPMQEFLRVGLTDPRVAAEQHPFDRPRLRSEEP